MAKLPIRPPKINVSSLKGSFWKQLGMIVLATTISLFFTIVTAQLLEKRHRAKDRRLSAMMVMSNIEKFSRNLEEIAVYMAPADSAATWLLSKPVEELELLPEEVLDGLITQATDLLFLTYDKTAESIFSNNIETWKNMGNVQFIDKVGQCFSAMNMVEERWNGWVTGVEESIRDIKDHPDNYEGSTVPIKCIRSEKIRHTLKGIHYWRAWLNYMASTMRHHNLHNMAAIKIKEKEVMEYTDAREQETEDTVDEPDFNDFYSDSILSDDLVTFKRFDEMLEEMKRDSLDTDDSSLRPRTQAKR
ncbi:MAG: hypothetical protein K6F40_09185 [Bacteroidales bacterium]|nr:hypothetical protein [Bacteroidales bacterium]